MRGGVNEKGQDEMGAKSRALGAEGNCARACAPVHVRVCLCV